LQIADFGLIKPEKMEKSCGLREFDCGRQISDCRLMAKYENKQGVGYEAWEIDCGL